MKIIETDLPGCVVIEPQVFGDSRGFFFESFNRDKFVAHGLDIPEFVQGNVSSSARGVLRGLHYQWPKPQGKYVSVIEGEVWDVAVDLRAGSPTFLHWHAVHLIAEKACSYLIPEGFAHGFQTLCDEVEMLYCHSQVYVPDSEFGLHVHDPRLQIDWPLPIGRQSERDQRFPFLDEHFEGVWR